MNANEESKRGANELNDEELEKISGGGVRSVVSAIARGASNIPMEQWARYANSAGYRASNPT